MSLYTIYFSPTGGAKKVVEQLAKNWGEAPQEIDLSDRTADFSGYSFTEQDACLIAVPSFGGRVPEAALTRLVSMHGGGAKAVLVVSYGNRAYDDTLLELQDAANTCGFSVIGAVAAVAEHSIMHQFGAGRPDGADCAELSAFAEKLKKATSTSGTLSLPGNRPFRPYGGLPMKPKASKVCTRCGLCAKNCPVGAIPADDPAKTNTEICISCMRCVQICPVQARSNSKALLLVAGQKMKKSCATRKPNELFLAD